MNIPKTNGRAPAKIAEWLSEFDEALRTTTSPTDIAHHFAQLGVAGGSCLCDESGFNPKFASESLNWQHANHAFFDYCVWVRIERRPGLRQKLRRVLRDDLKYNGNEDPTYGRIFLKSYARQLLDNFLVANPNFDTDTEATPSAAA